MSTTNKKSNLKQQMRKSNRLNSSKLSSLNKSIENFFIKILKTKTKINGVGGSVKKFKNNSNSILNKSSPVKLINKYLSANKKDCESNSQQVSTLIIDKNQETNSDNIINNENVILQNIVSKLNESEQFGQNSNEETSILKYLIESINNNGLINDLNDKIEKIEHQETNNEETDDNFNESVVIHETSSSSSNDSQNGTFLVHSDDEQETSIENNDKYLTNIQQSIILKALVESYPNIFENLSLKDEESNEKSLTIQEDKYDLLDSNSDDQQADSSVIIHDEQESDSLQNSDKPHNETLSANNQDYNETTMDSDLYEFIECFYKNEKNCIQWKNFNLSQLEKFDLMLNHLNNQQCQKTINNYSNYKNYLLFKIKSDKT